MRNVATVLIAMSMLLLSAAPDGNAFLAMPVPNLVPRVPAQYQSTLIHQDPQKQAQSLSAIRNMADRLAGLEEYVEAEVLYRDALKLVPGQSTDAGYLHDRIAQLYARQSDYPGAEAEWFKAFQILVRSNGSGSPSVAVVLDNMGWANEKLNRMTVARLCYEKALVIQQNTGAPEFLQAETMRNIAKIYLQQKQDHRARQLLKRANLLMQ